MEEPFLIREARMIEYVQTYHSRQKYDVFSYTHHLIQVRLLAAEFGVIDEATLLAIWGHDLIEDSEVSWKDISRNFGEEVADIIYCVTDELGRTRKEKHEKTYPKIKNNKKALIVKLLDRIGNLRFSVATNNTDKFKMYREEFAEFHVAVQSRIPDELELKLWSEITGLLQLS